MNDDHKKKYPFLQSVSGNENASKAFCTICSKEFSVANGGESDIKKHCKTNDHTSKLVASSTSSKVTNYFTSSKTFSAESQLLAAQECAWAYHTAKHNMSFAQNDCSSDLIRFAFTKEGFTCGRTKTSAIIRNVIGEYLTETTIFPALMKANFVTMMTDASNHGNNKMLPFVVRVFDVESGVKHFHLSMVLIENEKATTMTSQMMNVAKDFKIVDKIICLAADNAPVNFGSGNRGGENNVFYLLKNEELKRDIFGIGCSAHIVHNAAQAGFMVFEVNFESIVVSIHNYFKIYANRVAELKRKCQDHNIQFQTLEHHSNTRFLTLLPALKKVLNMFDPLQEFFQRDCSKELQKFFSTSSDSTIKFWLKFAINQLENFNSSIKYFERSSTASFESQREYKLLRTKITNRMQSKFIPIECVEELNKYTSNIRENIMSRVLAFYRKVDKYLSNWENSFDGSEVFSWMFLSKIPTYEEVQCSFKVANEKFGKNIADENELFNNYNDLKVYLQSHEQKYLREMDNSIEKWIDIFKHFKNCSVNMISLHKLVEYAFVLPGTSAEAERIFSIINNIWTDDRNNLGLETLNSLISIQYNSQLKCSDFFENIKSDSKLLKDVRGSEKYVNLNK